MRGKGRKRPAVRRKAAGAAKRNQRNRTARDGETRRKMKQWYAVGLGKREARVYPRSQRTLPFKRERKGKNIQNNSLGGGLGNLSQEQTRRVCDAGTANLAKAGSIRKRSAGYAMPLQRMVSPEFPPLSLLPEQILVHLGFDFVADFALDGEGSGAHHAFGQEERLLEGDIQGALVNVRAL